MRMILSMCWILCAGSLLCQKPTAAETPRLRLYQGMVAISARPPVESSSCVVVMESSVIYIEIRTHRIQLAEADLKVYEGPLTTTQQDTLTNLLESSVLKGLTAEDANLMPQTSSDFAWITARIKRGSSIQTMGYRYWRDGSTEYENANQSYIAAQKGTLRTLTPLVDWAKSIPLSQLKLVPFREEMCIVVQ